MQERFKCLGVPGSQRQPETPQNEPSQICNGCTKDIKGKCFQCHGCKAVKYCNSKCQKIHSESHKVLCMAIQQLTRLEEKEIKDSCEFMTHLNSKEHQKVAALVGNKCVMTCKIAKRKFKALWDSGAQVSLLSLRWLQKNFPGMELKKLSTLLEQSLQLEGVGGRIIPYSGYVELEVRIGS